MRGPVGLEGLTSQKWINVWAWGNQTVTAKTFGNQMNCFHKPTLIIGIDFPPSLK